ncbi:peptidase inhibitor family I36 protein [Streptomyces galbus]|uniref:peptidase inhibitor family I36 protein n=1 Tax=Streptomyces galbus TaxID=33898 RepID=UPI0037A77231
MSMFKKVMASGVAIAAAALGLAVGSATTATADTCPSGALCAYLSANYAGDPGTVYGNNDNLLQYTKFNNAVSVSNSGTQCTVTIYSGLSRSGSHMDIPRGYGNGNLSGTPFYKNIASNHWC